VCFKIGNTMPYSGGPLSNVGTQGRAEAAYFKMPNEPSEIRLPKIIVLMFGALAITVNSATAQKKYDPGASDTEIYNGRRY
jgi:hypothetical protein